MNLPAPTPVPVMTERRVSFIGALLVAVGPISMALFTPAMPELVHAFGTTQSAVKLTLSLYFAGFAFAQLFCGPLSDALGRRPVTIVFMAIYVVASLAALLAPTIELLIASRFLQGIGAAAGIAIARAVVRDLYTRERSARVMNLMGIILSAGPALSPTIGGITLEFFGWQAIFVLMVALGVGTMLVVVFAMRETVGRDLSRLRPGALIRSYGVLLRTPYFMLSSLVVCGCSGALYAQATVLPFILIDRVGMTPWQFGIGMLAQSGAFLAGALIVRRIIGRFGAFRLVPVGLFFVAAGSVATAVLLRAYEPTYLSVMVPIGVFAFGMAFAMPAMLTAGMTPFPHHAGAAAALMGFLQMGGGWLGGTAAALLGEPVMAFATVFPAMGFGAVLCWLLWRRLPEPAIRMP